MINKTIPLANNFGMNAAIDIGNSRIKIGLFENSHLFDSKLTNNPEEALEFLSKHSLKDIIVSSVGHDPDWTGRIRKEGINLNLNSATKTPLSLVYQTPETLGSDRIAAAVGAYIRNPGMSVLIIDLGTCATYDFLDDKAIFYGGSISPGIRMRFRAMHEQTARLPLIEEWTNNIKLTGQNTAESMVSGTIMGLKQEIEGFIRSYQHKVANLQIIFTGGDFKVVENLLDQKYTWVNHLVLEGLNGILEYNTRIQK